MQRLAIHLEEGFREVVDLDDVYCIEATEDDTLNRLARKRRRRDIRSMNTMEQKLKTAGFFRIQRSYLVNFDRIRPGLGSCHGTTGKQGAAGFSWGGK